MESSRINAVESTASIAGHPIHPLLVPFPIAFFVGALASDLGFYSTGDAFWARASLWLIGAGIVMAALAAVAGLTDFVTLDRVRAHAGAWVHFLGNGTIVVLQAVSWYLRWNGGPTEVLPVGLTLSVIVTAMLLVTGWLGGELTFRHGIGVMGTACELSPQARPLEAEPTRRAA